jgi:hypothetical protein
MHSNDQFCGSSCTDCTLSGDVCFYGSCVSPLPSTTVASCSGGSCLGSTGGSSYFLASLNPQVFNEGVAYNIKPSGIHFEKGLKVTFNYNPLEFDSNPDLYKYNDSNFENANYNINTLDQISKIIGSSGGIIELGDIKFEIQAGDINSDINFTLRKVNIVPISTSQETINIDSIVSSIKSWIAGDQTINIDSIVSSIKSWIASS